MIKFGASPHRDALRKKRLSAHLTQTAAAALVYVALRTWQSWEAGDPMPPGLWELFCIKVDKL